MLTLNFLFSIRDFYEPNNIKILVLYNYGFPIVMLRRVDEPEAITKLEMVKLLNNYHHIRYPFRLNTA